MTKTMQLSTAKEQNRHQVTYFAKIWYSPAAKMECVQNVDYFTLRLVMET